MHTTTPSFQNLQVYRLAFGCSVEVHAAVTKFPDTADPHLAQRFLATSRAVRAHIATAWGQRRDRAALIWELSAAQLEAAEMQIWIEAAFVAGYLNPEVSQNLCERYRCIYLVLDQLMATAVAGTTPLANSLVSDLPATA